MRKFIAALKFNFARGNIKCFPMGGKNMSEDKEESEYARLRNTEQVGDTLGFNPEAMPGYLKKLSENYKPCRGCKKPVAVDEKFCSDCHTQNQNFDPKAFEALRDESLEDVVRRDCKGDTPHRGQTTKFCANCGEKLNPTAKDYELQGEKQPQ
jgi:predicted amidophosphoribosyltransferase